MRRVSGSTNLRQRTWTTEFSEAMHMPEMLSRESLFVQSFKNDMLFFLQMQYKHLLQ